MNTLINEFLQFTSVKIIKIITIISFFSFVSPISALEDQQTIGELNGEMLLQVENTTGLPGGRDDLNRSRFFLWMDLTAPLSDNFSFGASFYGNVGTDDEKNNRKNLDNSESNVGEIDQFYLDWNFSEDGFVRVGKQYLPSKLSSMHWDKNINATGVSVNYGWLSESDSEFRAAVGHYSVNHIFSDQSKLSYANFNIILPVFDFSVSTGVTFIQVSDTEFLLQDNVKRTNTVTALNEGFDIGLFDASAHFSLFNQPALFGIEYSQNFAVDNANKAYRFNFVLGDNAIVNGWQFNLHYQDIERDASVAAYADDDWWFATWMKGYRLSGSFGLTESTFIQLSYFDESLLLENTNRILLEVRSFF